jgi:NAD-dependent deacetylase
MSGCWQCARRAPGGVLADVSLKREVEERMRVDHSELTDQHRALLSRVAERLRQRQPAIAFTGAGISTESGIPDFRGPNGLWKSRRPPRFSSFLSDPEERRQYWQRRRERYPQLQRRQPNAGHVAISRLVEAGWITEVVTQNFDGLHQKAGIEAERVVELHGSSHRIRCLDCRRIYEANAPGLDLDADVPSCPVCDGVLKESTISFGESLVEADLRRALTSAESSGFVLVVGSSLTVNPAAKIPLVAARTGSSMAIINNEQTPLDRYAEFVVRAPAGASLDFLASRVLNSD